MRESEKSHVLDSMQSTLSRRQPTQLNSTQLNSTQPLCFRIAGGQAIAEKTTSTLRSEERERVQISRNGCFPFHHFRLYWCSDANIGWEQAGGIGVFERAGAYTDIRGVLQV